MKKMFLKLVLLCLWHLDGVFGHDEVHYVRRRVFEGDTVTLDYDLTEMKDNDVIQWRFGDDENTVIAEVDKRVDRITVLDDVLDGRFRDRLKLDKQTGSLTITNIKMKHTGLYKLKINNKRVDFFLIVTVSVMEGDSITINSRLTEMKDDDLIRWRFGKTLIAASLNSVTHVQEVLKSEAER